MTFMTPPTPAAPALPAAPAQPPMFGTQTQPGSKPSAKGSQPTFLGANLGATQQQAPQKTLLGQ